MNGLQIIRKIPHILTFNIWFPIPERFIPKWVKRAAENFYNNQRVRPYNKVIFLKGKTFVYRVWFEAIAQGETNWHYYRKLKTK